MIAPEVTGPPHWQAKRVRIDSHPDADVYPAKVRSPPRASHAESFARKTDVDRAEAALIGLAGLKKEGKSSV
jgi:hypothetical protein